MFPSIRHFCIFLLIIFFTACTKNEFTLDFDLASDVTDNFNVTYYATDIKGGITVQAVASVREGKCLLDGVTKLPTLAYITNRRSQYPLLVYIQHGEKIKITGSDNNPLSWMVEGNKINESLSEWRIDNLETFNSNDRDSIDSAIKYFVEENLDNPVSTILLLGYFNRKDNEREYSGLMGEIRGEAKKEQWLRLISRSDQLYHSYSYPARLESMIMRSNEKRVDTLRINDTNPVFILFWENGYSERKNLIDSLKILEKELPDSSLLIADVNLDVDSTSWKSTIKRDSLQTVKRFWAPSGLNDPTVMKFKVKTIPYFIVFDKEGNQYYRGSELSDAMKEYRIIFNSSDTTQKNK